jgi:hypothetical protein
MVAGGWWLVAGAGATLVLVRDGSVDQWVSAGRRSYGGAEARRKQREEPTTRHKP